MTQPTESTERKRVEVWPILEEQAREDAAYIAETVKEQDLDDDETITLIQLTLMKASGALGMWEFESKMRDLFLTANRRKNGYQPLW
jgi:thioesterase domain-containing protein